MWRCVILCLSLALVPAARASAAPVTLYSPDPEHLWNRAYATLLVRTAPDGEVADDLLDPPLWANSKHLLSGSSHAQAVAVLRELAASSEAVQQMTPLQRALMQRDLLAIFCWLADPWRQERTAAQRSLAQELVRAIRAVALSEEEIRRLPDNYTTAAVRPGATSEQPPGRAFLPEDLLSDKGAWVALEPEGDDWLSASVHFRAFHGRSSFEVRLRHPEGRAAAEAYLRELAAMPEPYVSRKPERFRDSEMMPHTDASRGPWVNPATPQFPEGTAWALVRRAVLADSHGLPVLSPLVESVQVRVYRSLGADPREAQHFFEWEMRRQLLLGAGGFHLTTEADQRYGHFLTHEIDPFETFESGAPAPATAKVSELNCFVCHSGSGIHSVLSRARLFEPRLARPPEFRSITASRVAQMTELEAGKSTGWQVLRWLWKE